LDNKSARKGRQPHILIAKRVFKQSFFKSVMSKKRVEKRRNISCIHDTFRRFEERRRGAAHMIPLGFHFWCKEFSRT
jgi:hypothetical protein